MDKEGRERLEFIKNFICKKKAVTIDDFFPHMLLCERTLRRDINVLGGITSYTHRGKFITLPNIPIFDKNGIWFYKDIGFTKFRNSLDLIVSFINSNRNGITKEEIEDILRINISKQIQILLSQNRLHRVKLGAKYCYLPEELAKDKKRQIQVLHSDIEEHYDKKIKLSDLVAVLKVVLVEYKIDMNKLKKLIKKYSLDVPMRKVEQLLLRYDLTSKKKH